MCLGFLNFCFSCQKCFSYLVLVLIKGRIKIVTVTVWWVSDKLDVWVELVGYAWKRKEPAWFFRWLSESWLTEVGIGIKKKKKNFLLTTRLIPAWRTGNGVFTRNISDDCGIYLDKIIKVVFCRMCWSRCEGWVFAEICGSINLFRCLRVGEYQIILSDSTGLWWDQINQHENMREKKS